MIVLTLAIFLRNSKNSILYMSIQVYFLAFFHIEIKRLAVKYDLVDDHTESKDILLFTKHHFLIFIMNHFVFIFYQDLWSYIRQGEPRIIVYFRY